MDSDAFRKEWILEKLGSQLVATMVSNIFYGIAMSMIIQYFSLHAHRDRRRTKVLVALLSVSATLVVLFDNIQIIVLLMINFLISNLYSGTIHFSVLGRYATVFLTSFLAQIFYATRIWSLGRFTGMKLRFLAIPVIVLSATQLGAGLAHVHILSTAGSYMALGSMRKTFQAVISTQGSTTTACDVLITSSIAIILRTSRTGVKRTDSLLDKIIKFAIQWAAATCLCGILTIFLFYYTYGNIFFNLTWLVNTQLHVMSVASVLISREGLRADVDRSFHLSDLSSRTDAPEHNQHIEA